MPKTREFSTEKLLVGNEGVMTSLRLPNGSEKARYWMRRSIVTGLWYFPNGKVELTHRLSWRFPAGNKKFPGWEQQ